MNLKIDRTKKPQVISEIDFTLPKIERFKLQNGLDVVYVRKETLPIMKFILLTEAGSKFDPDGKKGLANLFCRALDEGAGKYSSTDLSEEFDLIGSSFGIQCHNDDIHITLQTLTDHIDRALELLTLVLLEPALDEKSFQREQRKVLTSLRQLSDSPDEIADLVFDRKLFNDGNPYSSPVYGFPGDVKNISLNDIKSFYQENINPDNSALVVVGNLPVSSLKEKLNKYFNNWNPGRKASIKINQSKSDQQKLFIVHKEGSVQSEIRIGHATELRTNGDFFERLILNHILGGQFSSRINLNLRENKGYTYGAHSSFIYYKSSAGFLVSTSVGSENTGNAIAEIIKEMKEIKNGIKKEELDFAKSSINLRFPGNFETYGQVAGNLVSLIIHSLPHNYFDSYLSNLNSKMISDINETAKKYIHPDNLNIVVVGDKKLILQQLEDLGVSEIIELDIWGNQILQS